MDPVFVFGLRGSLAALFAIATLYKLRHFAEHRGHVAGYLAAFGIARRGAVTAAAIASVLAELVVAVLCLVAARATTAAFAASGLLTAYALAMALRWRAQGAASCGCSWGSRDVPISVALVARNLVMAGLAAAAAWPVATRVLAPPDLLVALLIALSGLVVYLAATQLIENHGTGTWLRAR